MAKHPGSTSHNTSHDTAFIDLPKDEQKRRANVALQTAQSKAFAAPKGSPEAEKHFKAAAAASRVSKRLRGEGPSRADVTKPGTKKKGKSTGSTPAERRKPFEDVLPGDSARELAAIAKAAEAARKKAGRS